MAVIAFNVVGGRVVVDAGAVTAGEGVVTAPRTQYCWPTSIAGQLMPGFRVWMSATLIPQVTATESHVSPLPAVTAKLQTTSRAFRWDGVVQLPTAVRTIRAKG